MDCCSRLYQPFRPWSCSMTPHSSSLRCPSRRRVRQTAWQCSQAAQLRQDRSPAGKPQLHQFVSIRGHSWFKTNPSHLRLSVKIRVHPWRKKQPCRRTLGLPSAARLLNFELVHFPARLRGFACDQQPATCPGCTAAAGKPQLHRFVSIRVHSWFKTTHPPCDYP